jgi:hypothetical protein
MYGEEEKSRRDLLDNREGKRPLGRTMSRWEDNINMVLKGMRMDRVYCISHRFCEHGDKNSGSINWEYMDSVPLRGVAYNSW